MSTRMAAIVFTLALVVTACGGGGDDTEAGVDPAESSTTSTTTTEAPDEPEPDEPTETTTTSPPTTTSTTTTSTTTEPPAASNPLPDVTATDLPDLVVEWGTGAGDPLEVARRLIGFPLDVAPPADTTPADVDLRLRGEDPTEWRWEWTYRAFAPQGAVEDIDAELPEGGPGTIEGRLHYDPVFEGLGWRNVGQVISDPSSGAGGPQSVNWAYQDDDGVFPIGALETTPVSARAWVDEDIGFGPTEGTPGHQVEVNVTTAPDTVPVPLIASVLAELPAVDGRLTEVAFRSFERPADSFAADEGLRYLELTMAWSLAAGTPEEAGLAYLAGLPTSILQAGEESFFDEGVIEVTEPRSSADEWTQAVVLLDRYTGSITMSPAADGGVVVELDVRLEPNREVLQPPSD